VNLSDIVRNARDLIEPLIVQRSQKLEVRSVPAIPEITGDRQRLVQVLVNLLANASKFAPPGSLIRIGGKTSHSGTAQLWVEDEGSGPTDPAESRLFEAFRRSDGEDPEESGLGLGLFIVKSIIERHGGRVWIARTEKARTRATIELPIDGSA
jgi:signal transduction histidine kinase